MASLSGSINSFVRKSERIQAGLSAVMQQADAALDAGTVQRLTDWLTQVSGNTILAAFANMLAEYTNVRFQMSLSPIQPAADWMDRFSTDLGGTVIQIDQALENLESITTTNSFAGPLDERVAFIDAEQGANISVLNGTLGLDITPSSPPFTVLDEGINALAAALNATGEVFAFRDGVGTTAAPAYPGGPSAAASDDLRFLLAWVAANKL